MGGWSQCGTNRLEQGLFGSRTNKLRLFGSMAEHEQSRTATVDSRTNSPLSVRSSNEHSSGRWFVSGFSENFGCARLIMEILGELLRIQFISICSSYLFVDPRTALKTGLEQRTNSPKSEQSRTKRGVSRSTLEQPSNSPSVRLFDERPTNCATLAGARAVSLCASLLSPSFSAPRTRPCVESAGSGDDTVLMSAPSAPCQTLTRTLEDVSWGRLGWMVWHSRMWLCV